MFNYKTEWKKLKQSKPALLKSDVVGFLQKAKWHNCDIHASCFTETPETKELHLANESNVKDAIAIEIDPAWGFIDEEILKLCDQDIWFINVFRLKKEKEFIWMPSYCNGLHEFDGYYEGRCLGKIILDKRTYKGFLQGRFIASKPRKAQMKVVHEDGTTRKTHCASAIVAEAVEREYFQQELRKS